MSIKIIFILLSIALIALFSNTAFAVSGAGLTENERNIAIVEAMIPLQTPDPSYMFPRPNTRNDHISLTITYYAISEYGPNLSVYIYPDVSDTSSGCTPPSPNAVISFELDNPTIDDTDTTTTYTKFTYTLVQDYPYTTWSWRLYPLTDCPVQSIGLIVRDGGEAIINIGLNNPQPFVPYDNLMLIPHIVPDIYDKSYDFDDLVKFSRSESHVYATQWSDSNLVTIAFIGIRNSNYSVIVTLKMENPTPLSCVLSPRVVHPDNSGNPNLYYTYIQFKDIASCRYFPDLKTSPEFTLTASIRWNAPPSTENSVQNSYIYKAISSTFRIPLSYSVENTLINRVYTTEGLRFPVVGNIYSLSTSIPEQFPDNLVLYNLRCYATMVYGSDQVYTNIIDLLEYNSNDGSISETKKHTLDSKTILDRLISLYNIDEYDMFQSQTIDYYIDKCYGSAHFPNSSNLLSYTLYMTKQYTTTSSSRLSLLDTGAISYIHLDALHTVSGYSFSSRVYNINALRSDSTDDPEYEAKIEYIFEYYLLGSSKRYNGTVQSGTMMLYHYNDPNKSYPQQIYYSIRALLAATKNSILLPNNINTNILYFANIYCQITPIENNIPINKGSAIPMESLALSDHVYCNHDLFGFGSSSLACTSITPSDDGSTDGITTTSCNTNNTLYYDTIQQKCICDENYTGIHCDLRIECMDTYNILSQCSSHGYISYIPSTSTTLSQCNTQCTCFNGWEGDKCQYTRNCNLALSLLPSQCETNDWPLTKIISHIDPTTQYCYAYCTCNDNDNKCNDNSKIDIIYDDTLPTLQCEDTCTCYDGLGGYECRQNIQCMDIYTSLDNCNSRGIVIYDPNTKMCQEQCTCHNSSMYSGISCEQDNKCEDKRNKLNCGSYGAVKVVSSSSSSSFEYEYNDVSISELNTVVETAPLAVADNTDDTISTTITYDNDNDNKQLIAQTDQCSAECSCLFGYTGPLCATCPLQCFNKSSNNRLAYCQDKYEHIKPCLCLQNTLGRYCQYSEIITEITIRNRSLPLWLVQSIQNKNIITTTTNNNNNNYRKVSLFLNNLIESLNQILYTNNNNNNNDNNSNILTNTIDSNIKSIYNKDSIERITIPITGMSYTTTTCPANISKNTSTTTTTATSSNTVVIPSTLTLHIYTRVGYGINTQPKELLNLYTIWNRIKIGEDFIFGTETLKLTQLINNILLDSDIQHLGGDDVSKLCIYTPNNDDDIDINPIEPIIDDDDDEENEDTSNSSIRNDYVFKGAFIMYIIPIITIIIDNILN